MNIKPAQKKVIDALLENSNRVVVHRRKKQTSSMVNFGYFVADVDANGNEISVLKLQNKTLEAMVNTGLLTLVAQDNANGYTYTLSDKVKLNRHMLELSNVKSLDSASENKIQEVAEKFGCKVEYHKAHMLFKVVRLDGREFSEPFIDVSENGIKVTQIRDLKLSEWQDEIVNVIKRSHLL